MSVFIFKDIDWIWLTEWTTECLKTWLFPRSSVFNSSLCLELFALARITFPCAWLGSFLFLVLCVWHSSWNDLLTPLCQTAHSYKNCPSFTLSRNWQKEIWSSDSLQSIFHGCRMFSGAALVTTLTHVLAIIFYVIYIFVDCFSQSEV